MAYETLRIGASGERVKEVQRIVGVTEDGRFGKATELAVKHFQTSRSLGADGVVGPRTAAAMGLIEIRETSSLIALPWNTLQHPERAKWTTELLGLIDAHLMDFIAAKDATLFHPKFPSLTREQQRLVLATLFVEVARYESGFNPRSVYFEEDPKLRINSVGLFQLSVVDQKNYGFKHGWDEEALMLPLNNIRLAVEIAAANARKDGYIANGDSTSGKRKGMSRYWSVTWDKKHLNEIKKVTNALKF